MSNLPTTIHHQSDGAGASLPFDLAREMSAPGAPVGSTVLTSESIQSLVAQVAEDGRTWTRFDLEQVALMPAPHFYARAQVAPVANWLRATAVNGGRLVLRGTKSGVGTSSFAADFARVFNYSGPRGGYPNRIIYQPLNGIATGKQLIKALAEKVGLPISPGAYRQKSFQDLVDQFVSSAISRRATTVVLDHLELANDDVKDAVMNLMVLSDPVSHVPLEFDPHEPWRPRMGFILVTNRTLASVFEGHKEMLSMLSFGEVLLKPFEDVEALAEALRGAGRGFESLDLNNTEDVLLLQWVLEVTDGRISFIAPLLRLMEVVAMQRDDPVATLAIAKTALQFQRRIREKYFGRKEPVLQVRKGSWTIPVPDDTSRGQPTSTVRVPKDRKARIKAKVKEAEGAAKEKKKILGRSGRKPEGM